jgi:trigger factor
MRRRTTVKSSVETLNPTRVRLTVEVPFAELKPSVDSAYKRIGGQISIPGFRKGRVPAAVIDQRIGRGVVLDEAVNEHLPKAYIAAVEENKVKPLGQPDVDVTDFKDGADLTFTAEVDVRPEIVLPDYEGIPVLVADAEPTDDEVDAQIEALRARFGTLRNVERAVEPGDFVSIDLAATIDGVAIEEASAKGLSYEVGSGQLIEGLDDAVTGLSAGESAAFTAGLPAHAGEGPDRDADFTVTVGAVRVRDLPALDDEFAQLASEFDTLGEFTADVRTRVAALKRLEQGVEARDKVVDVLLSRVEVPLPEGLIAAQLAEHFESEHGDTGHHDEYEEQVRRATKTQFVLDEIATKENLSVGEGELSEYIVRNAAQYGLSPDQFAQELVRSGQVSAVVGEVVRAKALARVLEQAKITDESGRDVDLEALRTDPAASAADPATSVADPATSVADPADRLDDPDGEGASGDSEPETAEAAE